MDSQTLLLSKSPLLTEEQIWHVTYPPKILQKSAQVSPHDTILLQSDNFFAKLKGNM
jgi:hypothetical protein